MVSTIGNDSPFPTPGRVIRGERQESAEQAVRQERCLWGEGRGSDKGLFRQNRPLSRLRSALTPPDPCVLLEEGCRWPGPA